MKLPSNLKLEKARILLLKITVPANLYQSGIQIEVEGVEIRLRTDSPEKKSKVGVASETRNRKLSAGIKGDRPRSTQPLVHDPGGSPLRSASDTDEDDEEDSVRIPTTTDLAQSFLQAEPPEEKAELQATIAQSHNLEQSQISTDSSDEASGLGVGDKLSLPGFLADFLKGVGERVQLRIRNVEVDVVLNLELPSEISNSGDALNKYEAVTVRVLIEDVNIDGVTSENSASGGAKPFEDIRPAVQDVPFLSGNHSRRRISLQNVHGTLLSDASVFANVSRFAVPVSPEATRTSILGKSNDTQDASTSLSSHSSNQDTEHRAFSDKGTEGPPDKPSVLGASTATGDGETFVNAGYEGELERSIASDDPGYHESAYDQDSVLADSFYSDRDDSHFEHDNIMDSGALPRALRYTQSSNATASSEEQMDTGRSCLHIPSSRSYQDSFSHDLEHGGIQIQQVANCSGDDEPSCSAHEQDLIPSSGLRQRFTEDLTQSKIFSHEEAESMYMSAISHVSSRGSGKRRMLPGNWDNFSSDEEENEIRSRMSSNDPALNHDRLEPIQGEDSVVDREGEQHSTLQDKELCITPKKSRTPVASLSSLETSLSTPPQEVFNQTLPEYVPSQKSEVSSAKSESPLIIVKRFVSLNSVVLEVGHEPHISDIGSVDLEASMTRQQGSPTNTRMAPPTMSAFSNKEVDELTWQTTSIDVGKVELLGDVGLTRLTILIMQQVVEALSRTPTRQKGVVASKPDPKSVKLRIQNVSWRFVDLIKSLAVTDSRASLAEAVSMPLPAGAETLLKAVIENISLVYHIGGSSQASKLSMGKLSFGYDSSNILSFDSGLKMRESTRDILAPVDNDMVILFKSAHGSSKIECTSLPLHISLDLRRLDETFGWFGGFSSMLGLGNSVMSTVTVVDKSRSPQLGKPSRGVHFETSKRIKTTENQSNSSKKVTARIGGLVLDLHGTSSSVRLESTALKLVSRTEGLGVQLDKVNFSGPYMRLANEVPSITVKLGNIRLEYLSTPKEVDLARLLNLLSPSKNKYEHDDDILLDTLLRQRRQGGVIRATVESFDCRVSDLHDLESFPVLAEELKKLSTVTKYLPEDDRPGILTLGLIRNFQLEVFISSSIGTIMCGMKNVEAAHVTLPSLTALGIMTVKVHRNRFEEILGESISANLGHDPPAPMIMGRFVGNEMDPTIKIKLHNVRVEYHISTIMAITGLSETMTAEAIIADIASSVATVTNRREYSVSPAKPLSQASSSNERSTSSSKTLRLEIAIRDSVIGLNPQNSTARGLVVLTNTQFVGAFPKEDEASATLEVRKASLMIIDDVQNLIPANDAVRDSSSDAQHNQVQSLSGKGYVSIGYISAAKASLNVVKTGATEAQSIDIEVKDDLLVLESCADSTQTLQSIINGLKPPSPPSTELKYRTEIVPVQDILASLSGNAFATGQNADGVREDNPLEFEEGDMVDDEVPQNLEFVSSFYNPDPDGLFDGIADSMLEDDLETIASPPRTQEIGDKRLLESFQEKFQVAPGGAPLDFNEDHFGLSSTVGGTAHKWDTKRNAYGLTNEFNIGGSPLRVRVRDVHFIWNLFDGYDWQRTRDVIGQAVADVQSKATERRSKADRRKSFDGEDEEESVIGDFLFNSIYIGIPANRDPKELSRQVNRNLDDLVSETESYATSSASGSPSRQNHRPHMKGKRLRLSRSKYHKMTFELKGVSADLVVFPSSLDETQSSLDIRVRDLEIFDHVPTSTWKKFATYMHDAGERESGTSMVHLEILNVKPVPTLAASEIILKVSSNVPELTELIGC